VGAVVVHRKTVLHRGWQKDGSSATKTARDWARPH
jgi:hypothetical protein